MNRKMNCRSNFERHGCSLIVINAMLDREGWLIHDQKPPHAVVVFARSQVRM